MKKLVVMLCICLFGMSAFAQVGEKAVSANIGFAPVLSSGTGATNFGIGVKYLYNVTDPIRVDGGFNYWFKASGYTVFDLSVNAHYLVRVTDKIKAYPIFGLGYAHIGWSYNSYYGVAGGGDDDGGEGVGAPIAPSRAVDSGETVNVSSSVNKILVNIGVGGEYAINDKWSASAEIKYQYINNFCRLPITVGAVYHF